MVETNVKRYIEILNKVQNKSIITEIYQEKKNSNKDINVYILNQRNRSYR